jgi:hypothetical protein
MSIKYNINHKSFDMSIKYIKINVINISNDFQSNSRFCNTLFNKNYRMCHITKFDTLLSFDPDSYIYIYIYKEPIWQEPFVIVRNENNK